MFSITAHGFTRAGYAVEVQFSDVANENLKKAFDWLDERLVVVGITPIMVHPGNGSSSAVTLTETKECPIHHVAMVLHTKGASRWFSHKLEDGTWCRGTVRE
jgi:hypothetical protein